MGDRKLENVELFKYLRPIIIDDGFKRERMSRIAQASAMMAKLQMIW